MILETLVFLCLTIVQSLSSLSDLGAFNTLHFSEDSTFEGSSLFFETTSTSSSSTHPFEATSLEDALGTSLSLASIDWSLLSVEK